MSPKTRIELFNLAINLFWTTICCAPLVFFWISNFDRWKLYSLLLLSALTLFTPGSVLKRAHLSRSRKFYEGLGVKHAQALTQNGRLVNLAASVSTVRALNRKVYNKQLRKRMMVYERYHLMCLVFFLGSFINALLLSQYLLATMVFLANIVYNAYPLLIQQYNRTRMS